MKLNILIAFVLPLTVLGLALFPVDNEAKRFHQEQELAFFKQHQGHLFEDGQYGHALKVLNSNIDSNIYFPTAKLCNGCHGHDPTGFAMTTSEGVDVNVYDAWRASMMANSARDPFWRAKVTHEMAVNPAHSLALQDKCTSCHAPGGHYQAKLRYDQEFYTLADLYADTLGLDGVNCQTCHAQSPQSALGNLHSGQLAFDVNNIRVAYGPYEFAFAAPMHNFVGITPKYGPHINDAGLCAGCHTLITHSADLTGEPTGSTFVEQATYHEWINSRYDETRDNVTCQGCHLPRIDDEVGIVISANYQFLNPQSPYGLHEMAGANTMMLKLMKENREALEIDATAEHFDASIAATFRMLQQETLDLSLLPGQAAQDSVFLGLRLRNKAGHKFPSGYPARRAWVELLVQNAAGDTVFHSGRYGADYSLPDEDDNFEPHHQVIRSPGQVQIYELVAGDVAGNFTNVLERAHVGLKDNRLVPQGFSMSHPVYDTTRLYGRVLQDPDFNRDAAGTEGSGTDILYFHVPMHGYQGQLQVHAKVWYQSLPPKFVNPMFDFSTPEIDLFRNMYEAADHSPVLIAEAFLDSVFTQPIVSTRQHASLARISVGPNPSADGQIRVQVPTGIQVQQLKIYDVQGRLVGQHRNTLLATLPNERGLYIVVLETNLGRVTERVVRM